MLKLLRTHDPDYPDVNNFLLLSFCGYVIIWYLQISHRIPELGTIRFEFIYAGFLSLAAILSTRIELKCPLVNSIILLFLAMIVQLPFSHNFDVSWDVFIDRVVKFAFMAFFIVCFIKSPKDLIFFLGAFLLACMKMGQEGFLGRITGSMIWQNQGVMRLHGPTPIYSHPNSFSGMALGTIPFIICLFPISSKLIKFLLALQAIFALNIILYTGSRTGYVAFVLLLGYMFFKSPKKIKVLLVGFLVIILFLPIVEKQYISRFETILTGKDQEGQSIDKRKEIIEDALVIFSKYPFGVGISAFPTVRAKIFGRSQDTHNLYLEIGTNLGMQGLIIFALFIYKMYNILKKLKLNFHLNQQLISKIYDASTEDKGLSTKTNEHLKDLRLLEASTNAVILFLIVRLLLGLFGMDLYEIYWWFASGLTISLFNISKYSQLKTNNLIKMLENNMKREDGVDE